MLTALGDKEPSSGTPTREVCRAKPPTKVFLQAHPVDRAGRHNVFREHINPSGEAGHRRPPGESHMDATRVDNSAYGHASPR